MNEALLVVRQGYGGYLMDCAEEEIQIRKGQEFYFDEVQ